MNNDQTATTPEQFLTLIRQQRRGRLKIYLGFAAGVGQTYEMLQEGQRLKARGVDVVIGVVETHGRADTAAQIGNLEQVSRRKIEYRGVVIEEMDLDAILARHPAVVLVDELAHTNAPDSRYSKRFQDVEEILRARQEGGPFTDFMDFLARVDLKTVKIPVYELAAKEDHIAPARSAFNGAKALGGPVRTCESEGLKGRGEGRLLTSTRESVRRSLLGCVAAAFGVLSRADKACPS